MRRHLESGPEEYTTVALHGAILVMADCCILGVTMLSERVQTGNLNLYHQVVGRGEKWSLSTELNSLDGSRRNCKKVES